MRISHAARTGVAVSWLVAASIAGCSSTVDGAATCPGCGNGTEPAFPTPRPTVTSAPPPPQAHPHPGPGAAVGRR